MKKTKLYNRHLKHGAKMIPFSGYLMPVQYEGVNYEHLHVRKSVGLFDVSHMGEFYIKGEKAEEFIQHICTNDISKISDGQAQYSCMTNKNGGIIDDLIIYKFSKTEFMLVVNAGNIEKNWNWIKEKNKKFGNRLENKSDQMSLLALQGPLSYKLLQKIVRFEVQKLKNYSFFITDLEKFKNVIISTTGYTGSGGFEIYCDNNDVNGIWEILFKYGNEFNLKPIGLAARDTLRLEMGYCLYGNDINENTNPIEAGLNWITSINKNFIGRKEISKIIQKEPKKKLIGFKLIQRGIPRKDYKIFDRENNEIGIVTSGTMSPMLKIGIGLGYVACNYVEIDNEIFIEIRNKKIKAIVSKLPFVKK
jgi:aminomethyltransferase